MSDLEMMFVGKFYGMLIQTAVSSSGGHITVPELREQINILPRRGNELGKVVNQTLSRIAKFEHSHSRPMLTALVCKQDKGSRDFYPSDWFFVCAEQLGYDVKQMTDKERYAFWEQEFNKVHQYWTIK